MLLTLSYRGADPGDLGYLLHKHPGRVHDFDLPVGQAHVFYPELDEQTCTAALLLEVDPVELVRSKRFRGDAGTLGHYVNDRPYASGSMLAVALGLGEGVGVGVVAANAGDPIRARPATPAAAATTRPVMRVGMILPFRGERRRFFPGLPQRRSRMFGPCKETVRGGYRAAHAAWRAGALGCFRNPVRRVRRDPDAMEDLACC